MNEETTSKRGELVRDGAVFQLKLMADGLRDLVLMPVSLIATLVGLLRGGEDPHREFRQVIEVGRASERWINLFGAHDVAGDANAVASIDSLFEKLEDTLKQQYLTSGISQRLKVEINEALQAAQEQAEREGAKK
ncbi:MAG: hypothetical protein PVF46_01280 [Lysobacterales bacterium]|jgi:hypothetical protein